MVIESQPLWSFLPDGWTCQIHSYEDHTAHIFREVPHFLFYFIMAPGSDCDLEYLVAVATAHGKLCYGCDFNKYLYYIFMKCTHTHTGETHIAAQITNNLHHLFIKAKCHQEHRLASWRAFPRRFLSSQNKYQLDSRKL